LLFDKIGAQTGQITFIDLVITIKEQGRDHAIENRVAQKLQTFIMQAAMATMRQGLLQQRSVLENVA